MTNKVITQTILQPGTVVPADTIVKVPDTKEFMVIDYPRIGVDIVQSQYSVPVVDTTIKLLLHLNNDMVDASSYARVPAYDLFGGTITFPASTPPTYGLGANYSQFQGIASLATPRIYYPQSADFVFDGRPGSIWQFSFRHNYPFTTPPANKVYYVASFGTNLSGNSSGNTNKLAFFFRTTDFVVQWTGPGGFESVFSLLTTNYSLTELNHIEVTNDGTTIRLFVNGILHGTTYPVSSNYNSAMAATHYALITGGDTAGELQITRLDEVQLKIGGTVHTASFTAPMTEYTGTTGVAMWTGSKVIIPKKRVLEFAA